MNDTTHATETDMQSTTHLEIEQSLLSVELQTTEFYLQQLSGTKPQVSSWIRDFNNEYAAFSQRLSGVCDKKLATVTKYSKLRKTELINAFRKAIDYRIETLNARLSKIERLLSAAVKIPVGYSFREMLRNHKRFDPSYGFAAKA
ncbi:hypothetical protein AHIS1_p049 [Acaryochloris phage A-HIS1]|nr:hypothetical protein AHIS1_p049 [Acaryochloris phage A-HIS1]